MSGSYTQMALLKWVFKRWGELLHDEVPTPLADGVFPLHSNVISSLRFDANVLDYVPGGGQQSSALITLMVGIQDELDRRLERVEATLADDGQLVYVTNNGMMIGYPTEGSERW